MAHGMNTLYLRRSLRTALVFQIAWLIAGLIFTQTGSQVNWVLLLANMLSLWAPALFTLVTRIELTDRFQIALALFFTSSSLVGSALGGYGSIPHWDTIVHVYSGIVLAWFGFIIATNAERSIGKPLPLWFKNVVIFMTPLAFAVLWEIYEFISDTFWGTAMQAGGLEDTIVDMLAALIGAVVALIAYRLWFSQTS